MEKKDEITLARIVQACEKNYDTHFFGFFDEAFQQKSEKILKHQNVSYSFWGGNENAHRKLLCVYPDYIETDSLEWPIGAVRFNIDFSLNHRNVLGEILSYGIKRECIGDINLTKDEVQIIYLSKMQPFFIQNLHKMNKHIIHPEYYAYDQIKKYDIEFKNFEIIVASLRIDGVIGKIWGVSRNNVIIAIHQKRIRINYEEVSKVDKKVKEGDIISFRGKGKARIVSINGVTKKGNLRIAIEKYI